LFLHASSSFPVIAIEIIACGKEILRKIKENDFQQGIGYPYNHYHEFIDKCDVSSILIQRMKGSYPVPDGEAAAALTIKNSRFFGHAAETATVSDAKTYIGRIKTDYPGCSHAVYAYCIGHGASVIYGMSDAGEPSGTAGRPVLEVLRGSSIGDITLVVIRFFGGTKLGKGGLVRAYTDIAKATLSNLALREKQSLIGLELSSPYEYVDRLKTIIKLHHALIQEKTFAEKAVFHILIPENNRGQFIAEIQNVSGARIEYRLLD
jgi:uncharacterized YigZ family protein